MSTSSRSDTDDSLLDVEELLHIEARCRELKREKDLLKETQSQSFDLIKKLELHAKRLNEGRLKDKMKIQGMERELSNCHQEIDYLQDQLKARNTDVDHLKEHIISLEMKLMDMDHLEEEIASLRDELEKSNSECEFFMHELETKNTELQTSNLHIQRLEESISSSALEYECDIESMRLEMTTLKSESESLHELQLHFKDAQKTIENLENENKKFREMLDRSVKEARYFAQRVEDHFKGWIEKNENEQIELSAAGEVGPCGDILGPLLSKLLMVGKSDDDLKRSTEKMSDKLHEYEELVKQLKQELREEKFRAKEEAEDLAQEMAELRYQMTELLEEERKRRVCIEQASLQRISELEGKLQMEQTKSVVSRLHIL